MYKVIKDGEQIALIEKPVYIKCLGDGTFTPATEADCQGIAVDSVPYNISGCSAMTGVTDTVVLCECDGGIEMLNNVIANLTAEDVGATPANDNLVQYANSVMSTLGGTSIDLGGAKIATGSYTGTGTYGSSNPCSLTFDFAPAFVFVYAWLESGVTTMCPYSTVTMISDNVAFPMCPTSALTTSWKTGGIGYSPSSAYYSYTKKSDDGKTIYWYNSGASGNQFNTQSTTYYYFAVA